MCIRDSPDPVEHHDGVVDGEGHAGQHGGDEVVVDLARGGEQVERQPRTALIVSAELTGFRSGSVAEADLEVECGKGTFMRVLASDLGDALGVGGLLSWLERTRYGSLEMCIRDRAGGHPGQEDGLPVADQGDRDVYKRQEIGRASCRERV